MKPNSATSIQCARDSDRGSLVHLLPGRKAAILVDTVDSLLGVGGGGRIVMVEAAGKGGEVVPRSRSTPLQKEGGGGQGYERERLQKRGKLCA